jgi:arsenate reductase (thioredoxin)
MKILFVCLGNIARSQMAEAYFERLSKKNEAWSAGVGVFESDGENLRDGNLGRRSIEVMKEEGINMENKKRHHITKEFVDNSDKVVVIVRESYWPNLLKNSDKVVKWDIEDPASGDLKTYRNTRDKVKKYVENLIQEVG